MVGEEEKRMVGDFSVEKGRSAAKMNHFNQLK
jgi:hypothetical protein